jgi:hypothetical protein
MFSGHMAVRGELEGWLDWFFLRYPLVHPEHLDEIVERYGVDVIVARRDALEAVRSETRSGYDVDSLPREFENEGFVLFGLPSSAHVHDRRRQDAAGYAAT